MHPKLTAIVLLTALAFFGAARPTAALEAVALKCEYAADPQAVDADTPRLSWIAESSDPARRGQKISAFQILAARSPEALAAGQGELWDSGRREGLRTGGVPYGGAPLAPGQRCWWIVRLWDERGESGPFSRPACWGRGLGDEANWDAQWIGAGAERNETVLMRRDFTLGQTPRRATLYVCSPGWCEFTLDGEPLTAGSLDPAFTAFDKRLLYRAHDITGRLGAGDHTLGAELARGWFNPAIADQWGFEKAPWRGAARILIQLRIETPDGAIKRIVSGENWRWAPGAVVFNDPRGGETHDARLEKPGWNRPGFDDASWLPAVPAEPPGGRLQAQLTPAEHPCATLQPRVILPAENGWILDFGEALAGVCAVRTHQARGRRVTLDYSECLTLDGALDTQGSSIFTFGRFQRDEWIPAGRGIEIFQPRFTLHGFRYAFVQGLQRRPEPETVVAVKIGTPLAQAGAFTTGDERIDRLQAMALNTLRANLHGIPTDCPAREKIGWLADAWVAMDAAAHNLDAAAFYEQWLDNIIDAQSPEGFVPVLAPNPLWAPATPKDGQTPDYFDPWWGGTVVRVPWGLYLHYGDRAALERAQPAMQSYMDNLEALAGDGLPPASLGDWCDFTMSQGVANKASSSRFLGGLAWFHDAKLMAQISLALGVHTEAARYNILAKTIQKRLTRQFLDESGTFYDKAASQAAQAMALYYGLVPEIRRDAVLGRLVETIEADGFHPKTGILGTFPMMTVLAEGGRGDVAARLIAQNDYPGWGFMIRGDSMTLWEDWAGFGSVNHLWQSCLSAWFWRDLAGLRPDPAGPGYRRFFVTPRIDCGVPGARAHYDSVAGRIDIDWRVEEGRFRLMLGVPVGSTAEVTIPAPTPDSVTEGGKPVAEAKGVSFIGHAPGEAVYEVLSGRYLFDSPLPASIQ